MELALMIEGQIGLTWPRWQRLARAAEELGFAGLYRILVGTAPEVVAQLGRLATAGAQRVMVQWLVLDDLERLEHFAANVLPHV